MPAPLMTLQEVADHLRVHPGTIRRLLRRREIPHLRVGAHYRFDRATIDAWVKSRSSNGARSARTH